jgi:hypothetical protein
MTASSSVLSVSVSIIILSARRYEIIAAVGTVLLNRLGTIAIVTENCLCGIGRGGGG